MLPVAQLNGTSLYYEMKGTGTPIVFIHGHGWTHTMFKPQLDYFSKQYRVIVCDLRGNGKSGKLGQSPDAIIETQCLDVIMLMNDLQIREAVLVGISYGGIIVQQMARQYPERVKAIVIADSFCRNETSTVLGALQLAAAYFSWLVYYAPGELLLPTLRLLYKRWGLAYRESRRNLLDKRPGELYRQRLAVSRIDYTEHLTTFRRPALGVVGDYTEFGITCMKEVVSRLPQAQLVVIPDAADPSNLCQPDVFNAVVQQFLESQTGVRQSKPLREEAGE
ncbi:alpha/beta fold hydrolase [Paenibacillus cymbidii]|uniref:alpha/beta fold hydrolase n=1 Tax=Paenibacillus cymbidii TaxID=1639034 RepID=UPI00108028C5|nr:alpha/beta hydrolase [Paenibacillus cymbidii]